MVTASISEIYDLSTAVGKGTVLKIHTPTGNNVKRHLLGMFLQHKKFKYLGADVTLVPASTLPADPLQLGYEEGEPTIDPRDMVNPILYKWYHGEAMLTDSLPRTFGVPYGSEHDVSVSGTPTVDTDETGTSLDIQNYLNGTGDSEYDAVYPQCLMDPSFKKAGVQAGFRVRCRPYVYNLATNEQYLPSRSVTANGTLSTTKPLKVDPNWQSVEGVISQHIQSEVPSGSAGTFPFSGSTDGDGVLFTNKLEPLGWMDTVTRVWNGVQIGDIPYDPNTASSVDNNPDYNTTAFRAKPSSGTVAGSAAMQTYLPNVPMLYVLMPPAYKTLFYFRLIVRHHFAFRGFRSCFNVQSYGSASITNALVLPAASPVTASGLSMEMAKMIEDIGTGTPDSVDVENGEIISSADGML